MMISESINSSVVKCYNPSGDCLRLAGERNRRVHAWNSELPKFRVSRLEDLAVAVLPPSAINKLPPKYGQAKQLLIEITPVDISLKQAAKDIPDGDYWEKRFRKTRPNDIVDVDTADGSWKRLFMEKYAQEEIENMVPRESMGEEILNIIQIAGKYVRVLDLQQLQINKLEENKRINLDCVINGFPYLTELHIQFAVKNLGADYEKAFFEVNEDDCRNIGNGVGQSKNLRLLRIHHSLFDDQKIQILFKNMQNNASLETLDFSHCRVGDQGAVVIAEFSKKASKLKQLLLTNNFITSEGAKALKVKSLEMLNLRFNPIGDEGAIALLTSGNFRSLNLACCKLGTSTGLALKEILSTNKTLEELDLSNNDLEEPAGETIKVAMCSNKTLHYVDLRMTHIAPKNRVEIEGFLACNRVGKWKIR